MAVGFVNLRPSSVRETFVIRLFSYIMKPVVNLLVAANQDVTINERCPRKLAILESCLSLERVLMRTSPSYHPVHCRSSAHRKTPQWFELDWHTVKLRSQEGSNKQKSLGDAGKDETTFFESMPWTALSKTDVVVPKRVNVFRTLKKIQ